MNIFAVTRRDRLKAVASYTHKQSNLIRDDLRSDFEDAKPDASVTNKSSRHPLRAIGHFLVVCAQIPFDLERLSRTGTLDALAVNQRNTRLSSWVIAQTALAESNPSIIRKAEAETKAAENIFVVASALCVPHPKATPSNLGINQCAKRLSDGGFAILEHDLGLDRVLLSQISSGENPHTTETVLYSSSEKDAPAPFIRLPLGMTAADGEQLLVAELSGYSVRSAQANDYQSTRVTSVLDMHEYIERLFQPEIQAALSA